MDTKKIVNFIYIALGLVAGAILLKISTDVFEYFQLNIRFEMARHIPKIIAITGGGTLAALGILNPTMNTFMSDVVAEVKKVTWPNKKETYAATIVVIITLLIMAVILYVFDFFWGMLIRYLMTGTIYG